MSAKLLSDKDAEAIRIKYWHAGLTQKTLAKRYHVSLTCIHKITYGETYRTAPGPTSNLTSSQSNYERRNTLARYFAQPR
jgi:hypothetical protein